MLRVLSMAVTLPILLNTEPDKLLTDLQSNPRFLLALLGINTRLTYR